MIILISFCFIWHAPEETPPYLRLRGKAIFCFNTKSVCPCFLLFGRDERISLRAAKSLVGAPAHLPLNNLLKFIFCINITYRSVLIIFFGIILLMNFILLNYHLEIEIYKV